MGGRGTCWEYANGQKISVHEKKNVYRVLSAPGPGAIHVYNHNIQAYSFLKSLGQSKPNFMWSIVGRVNESLYK